MNEFEVDFINNLKQLGYTRRKISELLGITITTLKTKLRKPDSFSVGQIKKLKKLGFEFKHLDL